MSEAPTRLNALGIERAALASGLEVALVVAFLMVYIWYIDPLPQSYAGPASVLFFAFTLVSHLRHGDRPADLGIRIDTFGRALREAVLVMTPALLLAVVLGLSLGGGVGLDLERLALAFLWGYPWALFQEYGLQCVIGRRMGEVIASPFGHDLACAALFGALHLPNPFLSIVTFGAAYCFCALFRRCPNLFALALAHTIASTILYHYIPPRITHTMRVGPGYFQLGNLF